MDRDYEKEAKEQGWRPKEEFSGSEDKWTDAQTFVEKGEKIAGIMKSRLDRTEAQVQKLLQDNKQFGEYQKSLLDKEKGRNAQLLSELEAKRATAINDGDGQEFTRVDREIEKVRQDLVEPIRENGLDPLAQAWLSNNDWYNTNNKLRVYADGLAEGIVQEGYTGSAYYSELTRRVKEDFADEFQNKRRETSTVEAGGELDTKSASDAQTYENLPPDAKAACDRFTKSGLTTKEDYVLSYEWE